MKEHLVEPKISVGTVMKRSFEEDNLDIQDLDLSLEMLFEESKEIQQNTPENTPEEVMGSAETINRIEEIIVDRVTAASIAVPVVISKIATNAVNDTGAEVTVLSEKLYDQIPESKRPKLSRAARNWEVAEAGKNLTTGGITEVEVNLGSEIFKWPVYVAPIEENKLLGCDLIDEMKVARVGEKDTNSGLIIDKEEDRSMFLSTRDSIIESVLADTEKPMIACTQDMHVCKDNSTCASNKDIQTDKVDVQMLPELLQHVAEENENVTVENITVTEENIKVTEENVSVTKEIVIVLGTQDDENVPVTKETVNIIVTKRMETCSVRRKR
ncbi:unnamed protein product [Mytilus edulis]|uniref:Peptidase A2 domain-containing protein n=1 Tax=Mytilus edulis TaxID=6550 RepID=A0A8S3V3Q9_MYTED|nr:unnamed protein product [Mytilus edulis]